MPEIASRGRASLPHWSVRQFLVCLLLVALLPGVLGALVLMRWQYHQARVQLDRDSMQSARALAQAVDSSLLRAEAMGQTLAHAESLKNGDLRAFFDLARTTVTRTGLGFSVIVLSPDGTQLLNTNTAYGAPLPMTVMPEQIRAVVATQRTAISNLVYAPLIRRHAITVNVPVVREGKVRYVLAVGLAARQFDLLFRQWQVPSDWIIAILDRSGTVVDRTHFPETLIGKKAVPALLEIMARQTEGILETRSLDGRDVFTYFSRAPYSQWTVAIGVMRTSVLQGLQRLLALLTLGVVVLCVVGLLLAWLMGGRIAASVKALILPAFALGEGRAVGFAPIHVREAAQVADAIGRAQRVLSERQAELEARERELREAHRLARFGTWHWNLQTGAIETSGSVADVIGARVHNIEAARASLLSEEVWQRLVAAAENTAATGTGFELELPARHASGRTIWLKVRCEGMRSAGVCAEGAPNEGRGAQAGAASANGGGAHDAHCAHGAETGIVALIGTVQDITEDVEYAQALRASERRARRAARRAEAQRLRLDAVLEAAPVGIIVVAVNGGLLQVNPAHRRLWGHASPETRSSADYAQWRGWWADGPGQGQRLSVDDWPLARALAGEDAPRGLIEIETFDHPPLRRIALTTAAPVRDPEGNLLGAVSAQLDVSERVRAERSLQHADRRKDEFLAMLAHELRNPLAPIAAAAEILGAGTLPPETLARTSAIIARQVRHLTTLVEDLLDVSRVTRGLVSLERERVDLNHVIDRALAEAHARIEARGHRVLVKSRCRPAEVMGDVQRLVQVLVNLLDNAAKFTPAGGRIEIDLRCEAACHYVGHGGGTGAAGHYGHYGHYRERPQQVDHTGAVAGGPEARTVILTVEDNGPGMSPELMQSAFELFTQGERSLDRAQGGLGIGLALVRSLVEMHGGSVRAHSGGPGKGSCFAVRLPALADKVPAAAPPAPPPGAFGAATVDAPAAASAPSASSSSSSTPAAAPHGAPVSAMARDPAQRPAVAEASSWIHRNPAA